MRRLEDAAVADDPLLNMRLGLPLAPTARTIARTRRLAKSIGRWTSNRLGWPILALVIVTVVMVVSLAHSIALASLLASPCAFATGVVVARRRVPRQPEPTLERRRHLGQST